MKNNGNNDEGSTTARHYRVSDGMAIFTFLYDTLRYSTQIALSHVCLLIIQVGEEGAKVICIAIKMNLTLKVISLSRNSLPDEAKHALHDAWSQRETDDSMTRSGM